MHKKISVLILALLMVAVGAFVFSQRDVDQDVNHSVSQDAAYTEKDIFDDKGRYRFTGKHATICDFSKKERSFRLKAANKTYHFSIPYHYIRSAPMRHGQITNYLRLSAIYDTFESRCLVEQRGSIDKYAKSFFNVRARNQMGNPLRRSPNRTLLINDKKFPDFKIFRSTVEGLDVYDEYYEHKDDDKNIGQRIECKRVFRTDEVGYCKMRFFYAENLMLEAFFHSSLLNDVEKVKAFSVELLNKFKIN